MKDPRRLGLLAIILGLNGSWAWTEKDQLICQLIQLSPSDPNFVEKFLGIRSFKTLEAVPKITKSEKWESQTKNQKIYLDEILTGYVNSPQKSKIKPKNQKIDLDKILTNYVDSPQKGKIKPLQELLDEAQINQKMENPKNSLYNWFVIQKK